MISNNWERVEELKERVEPQQGFLNDSYQKYNSGKLKVFFDKIPYYLLLLTVLTVPLFYDKNLLNFYVLPKQVLFISLVVLTLLFWLIKLSFSKELFWKHSVLYLFVGLFLLSGFISTVFSASIYDSLFGRTDFFVANFVFFFFLVLFFLLLVNNLNSPARWLKMLNTLIFVGGLTALFFVLKVVLHLNLAFLDGVWNTVDGFNSLFGIWTILVFILSAGFLTKKNVSIFRSVLYLIVALLCLVVLLLLSFNLLWWLLIIGLVLVLFFGVASIHESRPFWLSFWFVVLVLTVILLIFGSPKFLQTAVPTEVALGLSPSWSVTSQSIFSGIKTFVFGSGLGTFGFDFSHFRSADFNYNDLVWSFRFGQPFNSLLAILSESGVLSAVLFVFIILMVIGYTLQSWLKTYKGKIFDWQFGVYLVFAGWFFLTIGLFFNFYGPVLWFAWWLLLGMVISGLHLFGVGNIIKEKIWKLTDTPQYNLVFSFATILAIAVLLIVGIFGINFYRAEFLYAAALKTNDYKVAETNLLKTLSLRGNLDIYHIALGRVYLLESAAKAKEVNPDLKVVAELVGKAVNEAKAAADLSPNSIAVWENLTTMYENASVLVPEAQEWVVKSLDQAIKLEPTNPVLYWRLGNNYNNTNKFLEAISNYKKAIDLKKNYVGAYVGLSLAYERNKQLKEAIDTYWTAGPYIVNNPDALFDYGRLLYNRNEKDDRDNAEKLWLEAVRLQPSHSNALYSLGLFYEARGDVNKALAYYNQVKELNPGNKDVEAKINSFYSTPVELVIPVSNTDVKTTSTKKK